jgi:hypothetical protein
MPEIKYTSWFQRITKSVGGIIIGIGLFLGSFVVLFVNEGTIDKSKVAATAVEIDATEAPAESATGLVAIGGTATADKPLGDGLYFKPGKYLLVERTTEVYAWVESSKTETRKDAVGGGETTITTYFYNKQWVSEAQSEAQFSGYRKEDYNNFQSSSGEKINNARALRRLVSDGEAKVATVKMGRYTIATEAVELPKATSVKDLTDTIDRAKVSATPGGSINGSFIYIRKGGNTNAGDTVGDERVSYSVLPSDFKGTAFGKLNGTSLESFAIEETLKSSTSLYRLFIGNKEAAVQTLHSEFVFWIWVVRVLGFAMMWIGLMLIFGPISTILDIVSILGSVSRFLINLVLFLIALGLSVMTILIGIVAHSVIALVIALVVVIGLIILIVILVKNKKKATPATT